MHEIALDSKQTPQMDTLPESEKLRGGDAPDLDQGIDVKLPAKDLLNCSTACCCCICSNYCEYPDCCGITGASKCCCLDCAQLCKCLQCDIENRICCRLTRQCLFCDCSKESFLPCLLVGEGAFCCCCTDAFRCECKQCPSTFCEEAVQCFCIDYRCALPCTEEIPCVIALCGCFCYGKEKWEDTGDAITPAAPAPVDLKGGPL